MHLPIYILKSSRSTPFTPPFYAPSSCPPISFLSSDLFLRPGNIGNVNNQAIVSVITLNGNAIKIQVSVCDTVNTIKKNNWRNGRYSSTFGFNGQSERWTFISWERWLMPASTCKYYYLLKESIVGKHFWLNSYKCVTY